MLNVSLYLLLIVLLLCGLAITVMTLPGLWLMLLSAGLYAVATHFRFIGLWTLVVLLAMAALGEIIELGFQSGGVKKAGAGRRGMWGALIGGILGGIFLSLVPVPVISTLIGVLVGTFTGAMIGELSGGRELGHSAYVGFGAASGRLLGTLTKLCLGGVMMVVILWMAFPHNAHGKLAGTGATTAPSSLPATSPSR